MTLQNLRDIKPPIDIPVNPLPFILIGLTILLAVSGAIWVYVRKRQQHDEIPTTEEIVVNPPHEIAFEQLNNLKDAQCDMETYHTRISYILREYIALRYRIPALALTSTHLLQQLSIKEVGDSDIKRIQQFFANCDTVKFANREPELSEIEARMDEALWFVEETKSSS
ncbi:hypothetical protein F4X73_01780 [Candidatus Poribacteria bacterium]|nr:hypothetical protein [Candidatus Poribacteria bacterium]MYF54244.1 hypothetical protein [Candidatus Poribacteria bacterium]